MADNIIRQDVQTLIDGWLKAEQEGEAFPVDFDLAWTIAGYSTKGNAKRSMTTFLAENEDYLFINLMKSTGGRSSEVLTLTCDGFKELCMLSKSEAGKATRKYFINAEKKWRLVQQHAPQVASEVEFMHLKIELTKVETQKEQAIALSKQTDYANNALLSSMATMYGAEATLALTGKSDQVVPVDRPTLEVLDESTRQKFEGQSLKQIADYLNKRYGIRVKSGAEVSRALIRADRADLIEKFGRRVDVEGVRKEDLDEVYRVLLSGDRQKLIGE